MRRLIALGRYWLHRLRAARRLHPQLATALTAAMALSAVAGVGVTAAAVRGLLRGLPDESALARLGEMHQATTVYDRDGTLVFTLFKERRLEVPLERVAPDLVQALVAIEDQRFYDHRGVDFVRIGAAALANLRSQRVAQGGSTITQQLARQSFLTPDKTLKRKLQEVILASRIERRYAKPEILRLYLNKVYFGDGLYGVEAAARGFFGRSASELSLAQAALLAGLVKSPSTFAPTISADKATERRNLVLQVMHDTGVIDRQAFDRARDEPVVLADSLRSAEPSGQYFKEYVRRELVARFGWARVYQGGLKVYSTLDRRLQAAAERAVAAQLRALDERRTKRERTRGSQSAATEAEPLQAALLALDPSTGEVKAMVGGRDFKASPFNRATQARRQPGSAFKPFVYAAALEAGFTPATVIEHRDVAVDTLEGSWTPEEAHAVEGPISIRHALRVSSNRAAVRVLQEVGISKTVSSAKALGVGDVPSVPSLALGSGEVSLQALTTAYAAFANRGLVPRPLAIRRVEDRAGTVLYVEEPSTSRAVSESTAFLMADMLADVVNAGTGARARRLGFTLPAAGKTGTTNDYRDAWFVGFTPRLVAGVWIGYDQPRPIGRGAFAADVAVPAWASFMKEATDGDPAEWLTRPSTVATVRVCRLSGKLPTRECEDAEVFDEGSSGVNARPPLVASPVYTEYFARGTEPDVRCPLHPERGFFGRLATLFTGSGGSQPEVRPAPAPSTPDRTIESATAASPEPSSVAPRKKKRGFWARLFGRGERDEARHGDGRER